MKPMRILATVLVTIACALPAAAQSDETAKRFHVLPLIADGSGWQSFVLVTNVTQSPSLCTVELHGLSVDRFHDLSGVTAAGSTATFELPGRGGNLVWGTENAQPLASGYATLDCEAPVVAQVVLASIDESGATTGMATVFSSQAGAVFQFPVLTADAAVGFAIANDTDLDAACGLVLEDPQRVTLGETALSAPSRSNVARMLNAAIAIPETFHGGSATVSCDRRVDMIGVHFELQPDRAITTFNTLPLALLDTFPYPSDETAKRFHVLPHIADGSGWQSRLLVTNVARATSQCTVELHGLTVDRFEDAVGVTAAGSTATFELAGAGDYLVWGTQNAQPLATGYATLDCTAPVVAQVVFASIGDSGAPTEMATVFSAQAGAVFQFPVLTPAATLGFAIANDTNADAECRILLEDPARMNLGEAAVSVPPKSSLEQMLNTAVAIPEGFLGGTARVGCDQQVAVTGIHMELAPNGDIVTFNTLPPAVIDPIRPTVTLSVSAVSIDLGEAATLTWSSTNAVNATITPDIGEVDSSGSREVSPRATTTYQITVTTTEGQTATASVIVTVNVSERAVLTAFYEATGGETWTNNTNWLTDRPLSEWFGVDVDGSGRVNVLSLEINNLTGSIPPELGSLAHLEFLVLHNNRLTGPIPPELGRLPNLTELELWGNELTGLIPPELARLANLRRLHLNSNNLMGPILQELGSLANLRRLHLDNNRLTGPIPPELGALANLEYLHLHSNELTGGIPAELGRLANLTRLHLGSNNLTGPIPQELGALASLEILVLDNNRLTGPVPPDFLSLTNLSHLNLANNYGLCVPGTSDFVSWRQQSNDQGGVEYCNDDERAALEILYEITGGSGWTNSGGWLGDGPLGEWYGVTVDALGRVTALDLSGNELKGRLPGILDQLSRLTELRVDGNALAGRLPMSLRNLGVRAFHYSDTNLCAPGEAAFQAWLGDIASNEGTGVECGPLSNREILVALYDATGGPAWLLGDNWLTDRPLSEWHGVEVDDNGRVAALDLTHNNLTGSIPLELASLANLTTLRFTRNDLTGSIPPELSLLANLEELTLFLNDLTGPIPRELGSLAKLTKLSLSVNHLTGPIPPEIGDLANLRELALGSNDLTGTIPTALGRLSNLTYLNLSGTGLTGSIPPELGALANLERLEFDVMKLTGSIPPELGRLTKLWYLSLRTNELNGPIPAELGRLTNLQRLSLRNNKLSGPIPAELGRLTEVWRLSLNDNELTGPIPPELGGMAALRGLLLYNNTGMSGQLPAGLTRLGQLEQLMAGGTGLCAPSDPGILNWLDGVPRQRLEPCGIGAAPPAYLTQAVQSRRYPVPLVAGEEALLRVFVTASDAGGARIPPVRARFYVDGRERHVVDIPAGSTPIPSEVDEGSFKASANARVPADVVQPGLEWVVEIDPDGMLGPGLGLTRRIPESGRWPVDVREMPVFNLTVIPFVQSSEPDTSIVELVEAMAADPEGHELLWDTRTLLPIRDLDVTAHESVMVSTNNAFGLLAETEMIRAMEGAGGHYMGTIAGPVSGGAAGVANLGGKDSFVTPDSSVIAHELGHNFGLDHAPCGVLADATYPHDDGSIGAWGYDFRDGGRLVSPSTPDLMSYCRPRWISDYHFSNALRYRFHTDAREGAPQTAAPARSLLLWGGVDGVGVPFLEPAFVVDAPVSLPPSTGDHRIVGLAEDGAELFSLAFEMPEVADGDGQSSFAFTLPIEPGWAEELAGVTLSGPGGAATLDEDTNRPVTILRNPATGQVRGVLRDRPEAAAAPALAPGVRQAPAAEEFALPPGADIEALTSRGLPDPEDWR